MNHPTEHGNVVRVPSIHYTTQSTPTQLNSTITYIIIMFTSVRISANNVLLLYLHSFLSTLGISRFLTRYNVMCLLLSTFYTMEDYL